MLLQLHFLLRRRLKRTAALYWNGVSKSSPLLELAIMGLQIAAAAKKRSDYSGISSAKWRQMAPSCTILSQLMFQAGVYADPRVKVTLGAAIPRRLVTTRFRDFWTTAKSANATRGAFWKIFRSAAPNMRRRFFVYWRRRAFFMLRVSGGDRYGPTNIVAL